MAKLTLYHAAPSRSSITRWMLEEIGEPYDIHLLSLSKGDNRAPNYLAVNPMGKVPALKHGDVVIRGGTIPSQIASHFSSLIQTGALHRLDFSSRWSAMGVMRSSSLMLASH